MPSLFLDGRPLRKIQYATVSSVINSTYTIFASELALIGYGIFLHFLPVGVLLSTVIPPEDYCISVLDEVQ